MGIKLNIEKLAAFRIETLVPFYTEVTRAVNNKSQVNYMDALTEIAFNFCVFCYNIQFFHFYLLLKFLILAKPMTELIIAEILF